MSDPVASITPDEQVAAYCARLNGPDKVPADEMRKMIRFLKEQGVNYPPKDPEQ